MNKDDYVGLLEVRCKFFTDHDYVLARGGRPTFVPANWQERIFFRIVVPDFDAPKAQLTGSRVYVAKLWDDRAKTMIDVPDVTGIGTCLDSQMSDSVDEVVKACKDLTKPEGSEERYLPHGQRNYIIGFPRPIIGAYVKLDSQEVHDRLKPFASEDYSNRNVHHLLHIGRNDHEFNGYIPVENILGYETPRRFTEKRDGFTGEMLVDWPPTVEYAESITGIPIRVAS